MKKTIRASDYGWAILDCDYSRCKRFLAYSTWSPYIYLNKFDESEEGYKEYQIPLSYVSRGLGIFSTKFFSLDFYFVIFFLIPGEKRISHDSTQIIAGGSSDCLYIFDIETERQNNRSVRELPGHDNHVNAVQWVDKSNNLIASGSDDGLIKLWDKRTFSSNPSPVGTFVGHLDGITFIDASVISPFFSFISEI